MPWIKMQDGSVAHICTRGAKNPLRGCRVCGYLSSKLCDFRLPNGKTCDSPLCDSCAIAIGDDLDQCPHHPVPAIQQPLFEVTR